MITKTVIQDSILKDFRIYPEQLIVPVKDATKIKELSKTNKAFLLVFEYQCWSLKWNSLITEIS